MANLPTDALYHKVKERMETQLVWWKYIQSTMRPGHVQDIHPMQLSAGEI